MTGREIIRTLHEGRRPEATGGLTLLDSLAAAADAPSIGHAGMLIPDSLLFRLVRRTVNQEFALSDGVAQHQLLDVEVVDAFGRLQEAVQGEERETVGGGSLAPT